MKKQYKCYNCEKLFERYECHVRNPSRVFCSTECSNKYMSVTNSSHRPYDKKLVLSKDSKVSSGTLKRHIIDNNIIEYICHKCGNRGRWGGEELILELHHLDGIRNNNEVDNLEFLCPNCHAQTETHRGKNNKDKNRVGEK